MGHTNQKLLLDHLNGFPTRKIALHYGISQPLVVSRINSALKNVPNTNKITEGLCKRFSGYLMADATYIRVKGRKYAFIMLVDYYRIFYF